MTKEIQKISGTDLQIKLTWTEEKTPQLSRVILCNSTGSCVDVAIDKIEDLVAVLQGIVSDRNVQQRIKGRKIKW